jgi:hypothetical protein
MFWSTSFAEMTFSLSLAQIASILVTFELAQLKSWQLLIMKPAREETQK